MHMESTRFGSVEIRDDAVLHFPDGIIGLPGTRYALVAQTEASAFLWLHSLEDPAVALPVTNPWHFFADYAVELSEEDSAPIQVEPADVDVWVTVRAADELSDFYANLRAPILVAEGRGYQVINEAPESPVRAPLFPAAVANAA
jgi:flagellar assembly factor FliW